MTINQNTFTGEFLYSLDAKGRVNIPAKFRNVLTADNEQSFVITRGMDLCVWVYPAKVWQSIEDELRKLSSLSRINRSFVRSTVRYASLVQYDKQGRIAVTPNLIEYAQLGKESLIVGMVNKIEIWNPKLLDTVDKESQNIDAAQFDELADQIIL
ncbi:MAG: division/cell wall cluster transcriptional repressor MraZ [Candidatus Marinimicrobia bacterium]|jgi:MraZ protein|nr:division/cell wall cluster transcriptional repressor MraZ [Candidatus Neomarinimicrobiota bacterium]MDP6611700.1 division/cell wall cluster transcriptional repressor MraZ [Candidatus Neomarinimicrobiota bacterium]|tara:strand:- start:100 stop:564 length:465 start_codon:yes stop_codon:yes gene_type:complete